MRQLSYDYKIVHRLATVLKERPGNPRAHNRKQMRAVVASVRRFGFVNPVLVDDRMIIIAGHARVAAAIEIGIEQVPTICLSHLTPAELDAFVIADNRTAELASWDRELLSISIASIRDQDPDFDISITGFGLEDIELLDDVATSRRSRRTAEESPPPEPETVAVSNLGDMWEIGDGHRLLNADATVRASFEVLMGKDRADLVITDPPWNRPINGHVSGLGQVHHREFMEASGEKAKSAFRRFLTSSVAQVIAWSRSGSVHYIFSDWRMPRDLLEIGDGLYDELLNLAVWNKTNAGMGSFYRSQHELIAIFRKGRRRHLNNIALGANGRHRSNVWTCAGANSFGNTRMEDLERHPTSKPPELLSEAILDASKPNDLILDPFGGSGSTLVACHRTGRRGRLMELDPLYVDVVARRAMGLGLSVRRASDGASFAEVAQQRGVSANEHEQEGASPR